jgi:hypothetical protein
MSTVSSASGAASKQKLIRSYEVEADLRDERLSIKQQQRNDPPRLVCSRCSTGSEFNRQLLLSVLRRSPVMHLRWVEIS